MVKEMYNIHNNPFVETDKCDKKTTNVYFLQFIRSLEDIFEAFSHCMIDIVHYYCHLYGNMMVVKHVGNGNM